MFPSEVAAIVASIEREHEAAWQALYGYSTMAAHEIIHRKYERMGELVDHLGAYIGEEAAMDWLIAAMDRVDQTITERSDTN